MTNSLTRFSSKRVIAEDARVENSYAHAFALRLVPDALDLELLQAPRHAVAHFQFGQGIVLNGVGPDQVDTLVGQDGEHFRLRRQFFERAGRHLHGDGGKGAGADRLYFNVPRHLAAHLFEIGLGDAGFDVAVGFGLSGGLEAAARGASAAAARGRSLDGRRTIDDDRLESVTLPAIGKIGLEGGRDFSLWVQTLTSLSVPSYGCCAARVMMPVVPSVR